MLPKFEVDSSWMSKTLLMVRNHLLTHIHESLLMQAVCKLKVKTHLVLCMQKKKIMYFCYILVHMFEFVLKEGLGFWFE